MKLTIHTNVKENDWHDHQSVGYEFEGKHGKIWLSMNDLWETPEDATLDRSMSDFLKIPKLIESIIFCMNNGDNELEIVKNYDEDL